MLSRRRMWWRARGGTLLALTALLVVVVLFGLAPVVLDAIGSSYDVDWDRVGNVSQGFGAIAAFMSAIALLAVAASLAAQARELRLSSSFAVRDLQFRLLQLAIDNELCASTRFQFHPTPTHDEQVKSAYVEMRLRYFEFALAEGLMSEETVGYAARSQLFSVPWVHRYWSDVRAVWEAEALTSAERTFVEILDEAHRMCTPGQPDQGLEDGSDAGPPTAAAASAQ